MVRCLMSDDSLFENMSDIDVLREQTQQLIISMSNKIDQRFKEFDEYNLFSHEAFRTQWG